MNHTELNEQFGRLENTVVNTVLNVWGITSPLDQKSAITISVGAKDLGGSSLDGSIVKILDESNELRGSCLLSCARQQGRAPFEGRIEFVSPSEPGFYKWIAVLEDQAGRYLARKPVPFSVSPFANRKVSIKVVDDTTAEPLDNCTLFFYNDGLTKTAPISTESDKNGKAVIEIAAGSPYSVRCVREEYVESFHEIPVGAGAYEGTIYAHSKLRIKIARPFG